MAEAFARGVTAAAERRRLEELVTQYQWRCERLKEEKDAREAEKKDLQRQLEKALSKAEVEAVTGAERAAKTREQGYQQGRAGMLEYLRKFLVMLAQELQEDVYF